jgi:sporulation protein YlmC with PRC-barrel domain
MKRLVFTAMALAGTVAFGTAWAQQMDQRQSQQKESYGTQQKQKPGEMSQQQRPGQQQYAQQLQTADEIEGMKIQNAQGEDLGTVEKVVADTQQGRIAYLVVDTGGLWGIGGEKAVVPWTAFQMRQGREADEQILMLNLPKEQLKNAPQGDIEQITSRDQARQIHEFYGVAPYWEGGGQQKGMQQKQMKQPQQQQQRQQSQ